MDMDSMRKLKLLMWKNLTLRRRQPVLTVLEILWPLVLMVVLVIIRQSNEPVNVGSRMYNSRALPSAGLIPFLQSTFCRCDPIAKHAYNGTWNDTNTFYTFNSAVTALLRNATLMLQDPNIDLAKVSHRQHNQQLASMNNTSLYQQYQGDLNMLQEDCATLARMEHYLKAPLYQLASNFPSDTESRDLTTDQLGKLLVHFFCGQSLRHCLEQCTNCKSSTTNYWAVIPGKNSLPQKLLRGIQILYAPDKLSVRQVITEANRTFAEIETVKHILNRFLEHYRVLSQTAINKQNCAFAKSVFDPADVESVTNTSATPSTLYVAEVFQMIMNRIKIQWIGCSNETELEKHAALQSLAGSAVWAGVVFENLDDKGLLKKDVRYTIRMNETFVYSPNKLRNSYWTPGPESFRVHTAYETMGFNYIQDMIDRGIVNVLTNNTVNEPGGYLQRFPYPCFIYDSFASALSTTLPLFMCIAWVLSVSMVIQNVVHEQEHRLKEMMKIMGLPVLSFWLSWFSTSFIIMGISAALLTALMSFGGVLANSNFLIVLLFMLNFTVATIMLSFVISTFFNKANFAALCGGLMYMLTFLPFIIYLNNETEFGFSLKAALSLLSTTAFGAAGMYLARYEEQGIGIQWHNIRRNVLPGDEFSFLTANAFIFLDTILYAIIVWYVDSVFPGKYGIPRPWYFLFMTSYWREVFGCTNLKLKFTAHGNRNSYTSVLSETSGEDAVTAAEADSTNLEIGVSICHLVKVYDGKKRVVDDLSLNFYKGQITAVLGHNGAGKTTTLSVVCGLFPPTSGTVSVEGLNIVSNVDEIRKIVGLCPQQDVLYSRLTVAEHLWLFAKLKGIRISDKELKLEIKRWLRNLHFMDKCNAKISTLSGGMKRKLSVAMAFIGGSKVVILDEPTAGVDPHARRSIWDIIINHRDNCTVILSTHYMDEADVLGDRIAIISHGKLSCVGSSQFLKRRFFDGYYLTVTKQHEEPLVSLLTQSGSAQSLSNCFTISGQAAMSNSQCASANDDFSHEVSASDINCSRSDVASPLGARIVHMFAGNNDGFNQSTSQRGSRSKNVTENVTAVLKSHIPDTDLIEDLGNEISFLLPTGSANGHQLASLLCDLDRQREQLGIASYGISDMSLAEVFLTVTNEAEEAEAEATYCATIFNKLRKGARNQRKRSSLSWQSEDGHMLSKPDEGNESESCEAQSNGDAGTLTVAGKRLLLHQFKALFIKRFCNSLKYTRGLFAQLILPAVFISIALLFKMLASHHSNGIIELTPSLYPGDMYIPFKNFQPWQKQAVNLTKTLAQPCGASAHYLVSNMSLVRCHQYLQYMQSHCHLPNKYWTNSTNVASSSNATCSCVSHKQRCPAGVVAPSPPSLLTVDDLTLQDLTDKKNMSDYILKSTDEYILHRYGGVSFGHENQEYAEPLPGVYHDDLQLFGVRKAAKAWYTNKGYHSPPIYLNVLNNVILRNHFDQSADSLEYGITTLSHPFNQTVVQLIEDKMRSGIDLIVALCVIFALSFVPPSFIMFLIQERATGAKHLQLACGVNPVVYWLANYFWDMCNYMVTVLLVVVIFLAFGEDAYTSGDSFSAVVVLFVLHGWAMIPMMYPVTFVFKNSSTAYVVSMAASVLIGFVTTSTTLVLQLVEEAEHGWIAGSTVSSQLRTVFIVFPNYCVGRGLMDIAYNHYKLAATQELQSFGVSTDVVGLFSLSQDAVGRSIISMLISGLVFFFVVLLVEYKIFLPSLCWSHKIEDPIDRDHEERESDDADVAEERRKIVNSPSPDTVLKIQNITKMYHSCISKLKVLAVNGLSLGILKGECFGLLGVNGAGKTTLFKMLTGDVSVTSGDASFLNHSVTGDIHAVRRNIGYCPQFNALNDLLTGREHLTFYARLKGIAEPEIRKVVEWCIHKLALSRYADVRAGKYSGGNKRKLTAAIALIGQPAVVFMDEPTTGMDPKSRRFLWSVINSLVQDGRSIVLSSHSMEECEAICTRIGIMVNGKLKCLGSPLHLKNKFGDGYTVTVRVAGSRPNLEPTKTFFSSSFPGAELKEEHHKMLEYQLSSSLSQLPSIFSQLESNKEDLQIEDYSVSQTTLDRVFLHFAKQQCGFVGVSSASKSTSLRSKFGAFYTARKQQVTLAEISEDLESVHLLQQESEEEITE